MNKMTKKKLSGFLTTTVMALATVGVLSVTPQTSFGSGSSGCEEICTYPGTQACMNQSCSCWLGDDSCGQDETPTDNSNGDGKEPVEQAFFKLKVRVELSRAYQDLANRQYVKINGYVSSKFADGSFTGCQNLSETRQRCNWLIDFGVIPAGHYDWAYGLRIGNKDLKGNGQIDLSSPGIELTTDQRLD